MRDYPRRKPNRLREFDYSSPNAYFITLCTKDRACLLSEVVGASIARPPYVRLSQHGCIVDHAVSGISKCYPMFIVEKYVIMPNHVHLLLRIASDENGRALLAPTVSHVIQHLKGTVTKQLGVTYGRKAFTIISSALNVTFR